MILALAARHRAERPAISMEGGGIPMEQFSRLPPGAPLRNSFHGERHFLLCLTV